MSEEHETHRVIELVTPLPCGVYNDTATALCGAPATVAQADRFGIGEWIVLPICKDHVEKLKALYLPPDPSGL